MPDYTNNYAAQIWTTAAQIDRGTQKVNIFIFFYYLPDYTHYYLSDYTLLFARLYTMQYLHNTTDMPDYIPCNIHLILQTTTLPHTVILLIARTRLYTCTYVIVCIMHALLSVYVVIPSVHVCIIDFSFIASMYYTYTAKSHRMSKTREEVNNPWQCGPCGPQHIHILCRPDTHHRSTNIFHSDQIHTIEAHFMQTIYTLTQTNYTYTPMHTLMQT